MPMDEESGPESVEIAVGHDAGEPARLTRQSAVHVGGAGRGQRTGGHGQRVVLPAPLGPTIPLERSGGMSGEGRRRRRVSIYLDEGLGSPRQYRLDRAAGSVSDTTSQLHA